jgi:hypothetical protein
MRTYLLLTILFFYAGQDAHSQILKQLGQRAKEQVRARAERKMNESIDKAIDSTIKKSPNKEKRNENTNQPNGSKETASTGNKPGEVENTNSADTTMTPQDGYIQATVAPVQTLVGAQVVISGETMVTDKFNEVDIIITPPKGSNEKTATYHAVLNKNDGSFKLLFSNTNAEGDYTVKVNSPDGKASKNLAFTIYDFDGLDDIGEKIKDLMEEASKNLKAIVEKIKSQAAPKDDKEIDEKMKEVDDNVQAGEKMLTSINEACGKLGKAAKEGKGMPENARQNLGALNDIFQKQEVVMKEQVERAKHTPADNTICEYIVMLNEACAAFSTFTNFYSKSIMVVLKNVAIDKGVPKAAEAANKKVTILPADHDFWAKEPAKILATAQFDAESFSTKLGKAGMVGDLLQYGSGLLLKKYCGTFSGELQYHYENIYSHEGENWWKYSYDCGATVSLRYPKSQTGGIIKMKGNIEGNATAFTFGFDVKHFLPRNIIIYAQRSIKPAIVPFVSSQKDELGFGAAARAAGTPAYFNLTVDAEYNTETETITLFYNQALLDFSPVVINRGLIMIIAAGIPIIKKIDFPINKMGLSFGAALKRNSEFKVTDAGKAFSGSGKMSIGQGSAIEHMANFTITAKKD